MRARERFAVHVERSGRGPAVLAESSRRDRVEVVDAADGEVVLLWEGSPREAARLARALREDLGALDAEAFLVKWRDPA